MERSSDRRGALCHRSVKVIECVPNGHDVHSGARRVCPEVFVAKSPSPTATSDQPRPPWIGVPGRVLIAWVVAGGIVAGGFLPGTAAVLERTSASIGLGAVALLFVLGAAAGAVHGGLLGYIGRGPVEKDLALRSLVVGAVVAIPSAGVAFLVASWASMSGMALTVAELHLQIGAAVSWALGIGVSVWAAIEGARAIRAAYERWNEPLLGTVLLSFVFAFLAYAFTRTNPEIWGTNVQVVGLGAVLLAFGATVWIALPVVAVSLHLIRRRMGSGTGAQAEGS